MVGKIAVMGLLERHGPDKTSQVPLSVVASTRRGPLQGTVRKHVAPGSALYTDALKSYDGLAGDYAQKVIDHAETYVRGKVHTNGLENFWSLLKRSIKGTHVSVEPFHLFRYLDEQAYRFDKRRGTDRSRFVEALRAILGKRLAYASLTAAATT
jgi:transposase-like protein